MKAKLIKKDEIKPALRPKKSKPVAKIARPGGLVVDMGAIVAARRATPVNARKAFNALFEQGEK